VWFSHTERDNVIQHEMATEQQICTNKENKNKNNIKLLYRYFAVHVRLVHFVPQEQTACASYCMISHNQPEI